MGPSTRRDGGGAPSGSVRWAYSSVAWAKEGRVGRVLLPLPVLSVEQLALARDSLVLGGLNGRSASSTEHRVKRRASWSLGSVVRDLVRAGTEDREANSRCAKE